MPTWKAIEESFEKMSHAEQYMRLGLSDGDGMDENWYIDSFHMVWGQSQRHEFDVACGGAGRKLAAALPAAHEHRDRILAGQPSDAVIWYRGLMLLAKAVKLRQAEMKRGDGSSGRVIAGICEDPITVSKVLCRQMAAEYGEHVHATPPAPGPG